MLTPAHRASLLAASSNAGACETAAEVLWSSLDAAQPVIMRAYSHARSSNKQLKKKGKRKDDYVELDEFRLLLLCMRQVYMQEGIHTRTAACVFYLR